MYYEERPPFIAVSTVGEKYYTTVNYKIEPSDEGFEVGSVTVETDGPLGQEHYALLVTALIRIKYSANDEFAVARQCLSDMAEYIAYNAYVEACKMIACEVLEMDYVPNYNPTLAEVLSQLKTLLKGEVAEVSDDVAVTVPALFDPWNPNEDVVVGDRRYFGGKVYKCLQAHHTQADWTPDAVPALWKEISIEEWPEWVRPSGAADAYNVGDKVSYNSRHYESTIDGNVWSPEEYPQGWNEIE